MWHRAAIVLLASLIIDFASLAHALSSEAAASVLIIGGESQGANNGRKMLQHQMTGDPEPLMKWLVDKHNELRYRHGVPALVWDWGLAWNSYNYVSDCPKGHSGQRGIGENLAWGHRDFNHAMRDWYDEIQFYRFNKPGFAENTGHFSMVVWRNAAKIGCAANLRCSFKTWICQFTPPGNLVNYGGSVDAGLWTTQVPAPSQQWVVGTHTDGSPSYTSYDPTGESTRGLPQPQYGELKNFGYVPKPGKSLVIKDWQKFLPTSVLTTYLPREVLEAHLGPELLAILTTAANTNASSSAAGAGSVKPGPTIVGWQLSIPTDVIHQFVPQEVLDRYVPLGVVLGDAPGKKLPTDDKADNTDDPAAVPTPAGSPVPTIPAPTADSLVLRPEHTTAPVPKPETAAVARGSGLGSLLGSIGGLVDGVSGYDGTPAQRQPVAQAVPQPQYQPTNPQPAYYYNNPNAYNNQGSANPQGYGAGGAGQPTYAPDYEQQYVPQQPAGNGGYTPAAAAVYRPGTYAQDGYAQPAAGYPSGQQLPQQQLPQYQYTAQAVPYNSNAARPTPAAVQVGPGAGAALLAGDLQDALDCHNLYRRRHQVDPLVWDDQLAAGVAEFVRRCPTGRSGKAGVGENLAWGYHNPLAAVDAWYAEGRQYNYAVPGFAAATSHFSQIVWASTQRLGCAVAAGCSMVTIVCEYYPAGNVVNRDWSSEVRPPLQAAAAVYKPLMYRPESAAAAVPVTSKPHLKEPLSKNGSAIPPAAATLKPKPAAADAATPATPAPAPAATAPKQQQPARTADAGGRKAGGHLSAEQSKALTRHNKYRARHSVPAMQWDAGLAAAAQAWADGCPWSPSSNKDVGQNMAWGNSSGFYGVVDTWYQEGDDYDWSAPGPQSGCLHFTQLLWKSSIMLGCAVSSSCPMQVFVCNYAAPGNLPGANWQDNILPTPEQLINQKHAKLNPPLTGPRPSRFTTLIKPRPVAAAVLKPDLQAALDRTNTYRTRHQAKPLVWDDALAASAAKWAAGCPNGHSGYSGVGENMAWGFTSLVAAVNAWYDEVKLYNFAKPGWSPTTGHFTALVWTDTTLLGCAINTACSWATYVCQYKSQGNVLGLDWSTKVKPAATTTTAPAQPSPTPVAPKAPASPSPSPKPATSPAPASPTPGCCGPVKASPSPSPSPRPAVSPPPAAAFPTTPDMQAVLSLHNYYRKLHQVPALAWDDKLVASAKTWANSCKFAVSLTPGVGENLAFGYASFTDAVKGWYAQSAAYNYDAPGWSAKTGLFSQLVWRDTTAVGCWVNTTCTWAAYVCHYKSPGNMVGASVDWSKMVPRPTGPVAAATPKPRATDAQPPLASKAAEFVPSTTPPAMPTDPLLVQAYNTTNFYRQRHQVTGMVWDEALAQQAAAFIKTCPLTHSEARGVGESMAWGFRSFSAVIDAWYAQRSAYNFSSPGWSVLTGHFTALVWRGTTKMGCAYASTANCTYASYICQFWPPGNVIGADWSAQVLPPTDGGAALPAYSTWTPALLPPRPAGTTDDDVPAATPDGTAAPIAADTAAPAAPATPPAQQEQPATSGDSNSGSDNEPAVYTPWDPSLPRSSLVIPPADTTDGAADAPPPEVPVTWGNPAGASLAQWMQQAPAGDQSSLPHGSPVPTIPADDAGADAPRESPPDAASDATQAAAPQLPPVQAPAPATPQQQQPATPTTPVDAPAPTTPQQASPAASSLSPDMQAGLDSTNRYRQQHQAAPLEWDASLAAEAAAYIASCPMGHSGKRGVGENLAWGHTSLAAAVDAWYEEVSQYQFSPGGFSGATGHFTALVWRSTTKVGCAANKACNMATYICQYTPAGNVMGVDWSQQVMPKSAAVPKSAATPPSAVPAAANNTTSVPAAANATAAATPAAKTTAAATPVDAP